ncbi:MAG: Gfo/Idh/MocA family protein [Oscillospiraceae bacterium]
MNKPVKIAMIGVGDISGIYLQNIHEVFSELQLVGVCDLIRERAEAAQEKYNIPKIYDRMEDAFADPEVELILNLTRPSEHFAVSKGALEAGKHVYSEKPLGADWDEGKALVKLAEEKGLFLGGAPDTFLGAGIQTCRRLIDDGFIGDPVGAAAFMICRGHEGWHHDPEFYYKRGGGPMMDMGPYYITALVNLLGGVSGVMGVAKTTFAQRMVTSQPKRGQVVDVDVPTFVTGILDFENGATGTIFTTFDVYYESQARLEIYGSKGTLIVPDPNTFGGPIKLLRPEDGTVKEIPLLYGYAENSRALGLADMAKALRTGRDARADYHLTSHVLEILYSLQTADRSYKELTTKYQRRAPMANPVIPGVLD